MNTIVISGPESSGKSTLAEQLGRRLRWPVVTEAARDYLRHQATYAPSDLRQIAMLQVQHEMQALQSGHSVVADTDLQVIRIWWQYRYGPLPLWLIQLSQQQLSQPALTLQQGHATNPGNPSRLRHYLICQPDLPWQPDPLRENPVNRDELFQLYLADAQAWRLSYSLIQGKHEARLQHALQQVQNVIPASSSC